MSDHEKEFRMVTEPFLKACVEFFNEELEKRKIAMVVMMVEGDRLDGRCASMHVGLGRNDLLSVMKRMTQHFENAPDYQVDEYVRDEFKH